MFHRQVAPHALGTDAPNFADTLARIGERAHKYPGGYPCRAMAGLHPELWDMRGMLEGKPVCALLGGSPGRLRAYASSIGCDITPEDEAAPRCAWRASHRFKAFKRRVGMECGKC